VCASREEVVIVRKTAARMSDGREIFFYDTVQGPTRVVDDRRDLPVTATTSELRYDPFLDEWVAVTGHRQTRTFLPPADACPLCPTRPGGFRTEVPTSDYEVVVFENRFPSFATDVADVPATVDDPSLPSAGLFPRRRGVGRCEVVCFTSDHAASFGSLPVERVRLVVDVWAERTAELGRLTGVQQVFCFENRGVEIGVTLHHPHGQIYGYPFVTPRTRRILASAAEYRERTGADLFGRVLAAEQEARTRVVASTDHWTAFVPAFARWPVEVHLYPHRHVPDLPALTDAERDDLAAVYLDLLRRCDALYDRPLPYIAAWHQAPAVGDRSLPRLNLQLMSIARAPGKLKYLAGSESGMGVFINDVAPEDAAHRLRAAGVPRPAG
jgi:UDPglucose--hexose-1-phosphate uridylyltransferase